MKKIILILFLLQVYVQAFSQNQTFDSKKLEANVQQVVQKVYQTSVLLTPCDSVTKKSLGGTFSGVVIDAEGHILSAAHAVTPNKWYLLYFPDGRKFTAKGLGRIALNDAAMLKINEKGTWPYAEMGWSSSLIKDEPCISVAYPGSLGQNKPTVRFGYIEETTSKNSYIRSTCLMEPGDSGGPVFDLHGRVIGLRSRIDLSLEDNYEIPVDLYRKYWSALNIPKNYSALPFEERMPNDSLQKEISAITGLENINKSFEKPELKGDHACLMVRSILNGKDNTILATLFDLNGFKDKKALKNKSYLVSKSSMVGDKPQVVLKEGKYIPAKIILRDEESDLVFLEVAQKLEYGIILKAKADTGVHYNEIGKFLISAQPDNNDKISVLGSKNISLPDFSKVGYIGITPELKDGQVFLSKIQGRSPASIAKLEVGDQLLSINGIAINQPLDLSKEIQKYKPNDKIKLRIQREGTAFDQEITLKSRGQISGTHIADKFTDGKSERRYGFNHILVHDGKLKPSECGGPLFDVNGEFYGINIARFSRTSSLAIPVDAIDQFIKKAILRI